MGMRTMTFEDVAAKSPGTLAPRDEEKPALTPPRPERPVESAPAQKSQRLSSTLDHAGVGIAELDAEGKLLRVNSHLCTLMGYGPDELIGRSMFDETYAEDAQIDRLRFQRQVTGEIDRYTMEKRIRRKDGGFFWASISSSSVLSPAGEFLYAVRVQLDITDRKRAETALAQRMDEQSALFAFTEAMQHARSASQVHEAALDAILRALRCDRASILLADESGMMRFAAARGLS